MELHDGCVAGATAAGASVAPTTQQKKGKLFGHFQSLKNVT
jgi:hypothetical protein